MTPRELPDAWGAVLGPRGTGAAGLWGAWDASGGIEPAELRACARWCERRSGELAERAGTERGLAGEAAEALGDGWPAHGLRALVAAGPGPLDAGAGLLRTIAEVLEAGARAVEAIRTQHVAALDQALGAGDAALLDDEGATAVRAEFGHSCAETGAAMRRLADAIAATLTECAAELGSGAAGVQGAERV